MKMWDKVFISLIVIGACISIVSLFQWWMGNQSVERLSEAEIATWSQDTTLTATIKDTSSPIRNEKRMMSNQINKYQKGEKIGRLIIPRINQGFTTYWGAEEDVLTRGVGLYESKWTTTPDQHGHTFLSGHRDTVFSNLDEVEEGDSIYFEFEGKKYEYMVNDIWITDASDRTVIVEKDEATLTLSTCYPFNYVGSAPDRYIIESKQVGVSEM